MIPRLFTGIYYHPITIRVDYMGELPALCVELGDLLKMLPPLLSLSHGYAASRGGKKVAPGPASGWRSKISKKLKST